MALLNSRLARFILKDCLNPTVNTQPKDVKRLPFPVPSIDIENAVSSLAKKCVELKKQIDEKYILNGANNSPLCIRSTVKESVWSIISDEIERYAKILVYESVIDYKINSVYSLSESDEKKVSAKKGICVANYPVLEDAYNIEDIKQTHYIDGLVSRKKQIIPLIISKLN